MFYWLCIIILFKAGVLIKIYQIKALLLLFAVIGLKPKNCNKSKDYKDNRRMRPEAVVSINFKGFCANLPLYLLVNLLRVYVDYLVSLHFQVAFAKIPLHKYLWDGVYNLHDFLSKKKEREKDMINFFRTISLYFMSNRMLKCISYYALLCLIVPFFNHIPIYRMFSLTLICSFNSNLI